ncbi:FUSC family protein [Acinetobacter sp. WZC-1]|uniref:FUSC family protein n=1 Tax=Acinetobacter sp. WZC-1 TaxID=3459034 RepID=UPI00403D57C8
MSLLKQLLAFRPGRADLIFAVKTFIAGMLALYIAFLLNLDYPMWALGAVLVIANPYAGMSSSKSMYRLLGTLVGAVFAVVITPPLINMPWVFVLVLAAWVGVCLYIALLDRTPRNYAFLLAGFSAVIICLNAVANADTASIFDMALGRSLEIALGVVCNAVVSAVILPVHVGPVLQSRVDKVLVDTQALFDHILLDDQHQPDYIQSLAVITRDTSDLHAMAVHLSYENSRLKGMTHPIQELLHQIAMLVANLVAMSERIRQLDQSGQAYRPYLKKLHDDISIFLNDEQDIQINQLKYLPEQFDQFFIQICEQANPAQQVILTSLKMEIRHFVQNVRVIRLIWQQIQQGKRGWPAAIAPLTTSYPSLHRDYGVAARGGISAFIAIIMASAVWIFSGWATGYMVVQMTAVSSCILTALDNPVPALKIFTWAGIYAIVFVFIYVFGILPTVSSFWQLVVVLAPLFIYLLSMYPHPSLLGLSLPLIMSIAMGLNPHNYYAPDRIMFFEGSMASALGPIIAVYVIHLVRAMSPEVTVQRILALHYRDMYQSIQMSDGQKFRIHLRGMLDRIGMSNARPIQSEVLKAEMNQALIETVMVMDLIRLRELGSQLTAAPGVLAEILQLQRKLNRWFRAKEIGQENQQQWQKIIQLLQQLNISVQQVDDRQLRHQIGVSVNNICSAMGQDDISVSPLADIPIGVGKWAS